MKKQKYSKPKYSTKFIRVSPDDWTDPKYEMSDRNFRKKSSPERTSGSADNYRQRNNKVL